MKKSDVMKRLLCIVGSMNAGGAETFLMKIYRQLDKTKYQMDFAVAIQGKGFYDDEIISLGGEIFHITPKSEGIIKNFCAIRRLVKEERYQYVLRTSQHSLSALELLAAWMGGAKVRVFRSSNSNTTTGGGADLKLHKLCMFMPKLFANVRIAPSTEAAEFMFGKGCVSAGKAQIVHNGINLNLYYYSQENHKSVRKEFDIEDKYVVGHIGRFNQQKNHKKLIEIFTELKREKPNAVLMLVGKGELEEDIRELVRDKCLEDSVIFSGVRNDVPRLLSGMDVFVFPSFYEGMPNTIIEAQATGLPCLIADTITREADITGLVHYLPLGNAVIWANYIDHMPKKIRMTPTQKFKEECYDIETVAKQFVKLIFQNKIGGKL